MGHTSDEIYATIAKLTRTIGKKPVGVDEACDLVYTRVASAEGVDTAMKLGTITPWPPPWAT